MHDEASSSDWDWMEAHAYKARIEMYTALRDRAVGIMDTVGSVDVGQAVVRENMPMLVPAIDLARANGWL